MPISNDPNRWAFNTPKTLNTLTGVAVGTKLEIQNQTMGPVAAGEIEY